jgi:polysaccharide biosynthesis protein PslH
MKILFLSRWFPFPVDNGSKIRIHNLLRGLSQVHDVTLLSFYNPEDISAAEAKQYPYCSNVRVVAWKPFDHKSKKARIGLFSATPRSLLDTYSSEMDSLIRQELSNEKYDVIIASQLTMASYFPAFGDVPAIFEEVELGLYVEQLFSRKNWIWRLRLGLTWLKLQRYFRHMLKSFRFCTVVSEQECKIFVEHFPAYRGKVELFPNALNVQEYEGLAQTPVNNQLIFTGSFRYRPNYYAMQWFLGNVYPLVIRQIPQVQLIITGDSDNLPLPCMENVTLAGYVNDIKSLLASCSVSIAPLWSGGGTRLKILEAMALGTPVVATSKGAEGLAVQHGEHLLICDDPNSFAQSIVQLLRDEGFRTRITTNARQLVQARYNWPTMMPEFLDLVEKAAAG